MAEVLTRFTEPVVGTDGVAYRAQASGAAMDDGRWEGWIEFVPLQAGTPVRSPRETTQPDRDEAVYWATGLTAVYLEGALERALHPMTVQAAAPAHPLFDAPAPELTSVEAPPGGPPAVLNPFSVYEKGETLLRQQLGALSAWHLANIIAAHELSDAPASVLERTPKPDLIGLIIDAVRERMRVRNGRPAPRR